LNELKRAQKRDPFVLTAKRKELLKRRRRSIHQIHAKMLEISLQPSSKSKIMYLAYVNFATANDQIAKLVSHGFLEFDKPRRLYQTRPKGRNFIAKFKEIEI
jgi:predicted transcriptional regulator